MRETVKGPQTSRSPKTSMRQRKATFGQTLFSEHQPATPGMAEPGNQTNPAEAPPQSISFNLATIPLLPPGQSEAGVIQRPSQSPALGSARQAPVGPDTGGQPRPKPILGESGPKPPSIQQSADYQAHRLSRSLGARAFTTGQDIFFKRGEYDPSSRRGQTLLAHELAHVDQQRSQPSFGVIQRMTDKEYEEALEIIAQNIRRITTHKQRNAIREARSVTEIDQDVLRAYLGTGKFLPRDYVGVNDIANELRLMADDDLVRLKIASSKSEKSPKNDPEANISEKKLREKASTDVAQKPVNRKAPSESVQKNLAAGLVSRALCDARQGHQRRYGHAYVFRPRSGQIIHGQTSTT